MTTPRRKSAVVNGRRISKGQKTKPTTPNGKQGVQGVLRFAGDLRHIEERARLSLESFRYTRDHYWLACAFADCQKGRLDWDLLCILTLGDAVPRPEPADQGAAREEVALSPAAALR